MMMPSIRGCDSAEEVSAEAKKHIARFQAQVFRLAMDANKPKAQAQNPRNSHLPGAPLAGEAEMLSEQRWPAVVRAAVPCWCDPQISVTDVVAQAMSRGGAKGGDKTLECVRGARAVFDFANMAGDVQRANPLPGQPSTLSHTIRLGLTLQGGVCPGSVPPRRAMHLIWPRAAQTAVNAVAVLCAEARAQREEVDEMRAFAMVLSHIRAALPCAAGDPYAGSHISKEGLHACCKTLKEYEWSPFCHWRPVSKPRVTEQDATDSRRQAVRR
eukprot:1567391-Rhodomonas_salina.1